MTSSVPLKTTTNNPSSFGMNMKIMIENKALYKLRRFIDESPTEISGLGVVENQKNNPTITDIFIGPQENTAGSTDMTDVHAMLQYAVEAGYPPENLRCWWHSHAKMETFMSPTDTSTIEEMLKYMGGWLLSICGNHKGNWTTRLDVIDPYRITLTNLNIHELNPTKCVCAPCLCFEDSELNEFVNSEIKEKVKIWKPQPSVVKTYYSRSDEKKKPVIITNGTDPLGEPLARGGPLGGLAPTTDHIRRGLEERSTGGIIIPDKNWERGVREAIETNAAGDIVSINKGQETKVPLARVMVRRIEKLIGKR